MDDVREESSRSDIRRLLKTFGVKADEAIIQYLTRHPQGEPLLLRITLDQISGETSEADRLHFTVEGQVRR